MKNNNLYRMISSGFVAAILTAPLVGCGGNSDVEFPETPAEMPAEDDESAEGPQTESEEG